MHRTFIAITVAILSFLLPACVAQTPSTSVPATGQNTGEPAATADEALPPPVSPILQPALDTVRRTLSGLRLEKWKRGSIRDEASQNIDEIVRDITVNLPPMERDADAAPAALSKMLPLSRNVGALYDVMLRVEEAARISAPEDQASALQQALAALSSARLALNDRMQSSADMAEKQLADLRSTIRLEAERRGVSAQSAAPCVPASAKKPAKHAAKPAAKKPAAATTPAANAGSQPQTSH